MPPIFEGVIAGFILMICLGPSFFYLLGVSIQHGFKEGGFFALGIFLSDMIVILGVFLGLRPVFEMKLFQQIFSAVAGVAILFLAISYWRKGGEEQGEMVTRSRPAFWFTLKGFGINVLNPFTFFVWLTIMAALSVEKDYDDYQYVQFFIGMLGTVLLSDLGKALIAQKLSKLLNAKRMRVMNRILGIVFLGLSIRLLYTFAMLLIYKDYEMALVNPDVLLGLT